APHLLSPQRILALIRHFREARYDLVQTHLDYSNILGSIAGRVTGTPVIATLHSTSKEPRFHNPLRQTLETWMLRYGAQAVVAVGEQVAQAHAPRMKGHSIDVIPNAVPEIPPLDAEKRAALRTRLGATPQDVVLISVGRLAAPKGYPDLLQAFAQLAPEYPQAILWVVGDGDLWDALHAQRAALGLQTRVHFLGRRSDVPDLLNAADIFVSASHWEGLPLAVLEAMMAGLPVVATAVGDTPNIVPLGASRLVPPHQPAALAQALGTLVKDPATRARWGATSKAYAREHFGVGAWMERLKSLYARVLAREET
ncbi:MAG: glycosyltransferase, partial [Anaerolineae bacterium]